MHNINITAVLGKAFAICYRKPRRINYRCYCYYVGRSPRFVHRIIKYLAVRLCFYFGPKTVVVVVFLKNNTYIYTSVPREHRANIVNQNKGLPRLTSISRLINH